MPVVSRTGRVASGVGMTGVALDRVDFPALVGRGGGPCFPDDGHLLYQACTGAGCHLELLDLKTGEVRAVDDYGANVSVAGGGVWAAWLGLDLVNPQPGGYGYKDSLGRKHENWYPVAVDDASGTVFVVQGYFGGPVSHGVLFRDGTWLQLGEGWIDAPLEASFRLGVLTWSLHGTLMQWDAATGVVTIREKLAAGVRQAGGLLVGWSDAHGLVIYPVGDRHGIVVSADGRDFDPDAVAIGDFILIATSETQGGRGQDQRTYSVDWPARTVNGQARPLVDVTAPAFAPAHITCWPFDWPAPGLETAFEWGTVRAGVDGQAEVPDLIARSSTSGKPSLAYLDQPFDATLVPDTVDHVGVKGYPEGDERKGIPIEPVQRTVDRARRGIEAIDARQNGQRCVLFLAVYTGSGAWPLAHVRKVLAAMWALAAEKGIGVAPFGIIRPPVQADLESDLGRMLGAALGGAPYFRRATTPAPVPVPAPQPQPSSLEFLMGALTLKRSQFKDGSFDPSRKLYPDVTDHSKHLSIDSVTGDPRPGGMPGNGPSESFIVKGDRAVVDFGTHAYTFPVTD